MASRNPWPVANHAVDCYLISHCLRCRANVSRGLWTIPSGAIFATRGISSIVSRWIKVFSPILRDCGSNPDGRLMNTNKATLREVQMNSKSFLRQLSFLDSLLLSFNRFLLEHVVCSFVSILGTSDTHWFLVSQLIQFEILLRTEIHFIPASFSTTV